MFQMKSGLKTEWYHYMQGYIHLVKKCLLNSYLAFARQRADMRSPAVTDTAVALKIYGN